MSRSFISLELECICLTGTYIALLFFSTAKLLMKKSLRQMPHCEGSPSRFYRQLYDLDPSMVGDASLVMTKRSEDSSIIFHAGSSNGIVEGLKLSVYANNLADPVRNPCLGELVVWSVDEFTSLLVCEPTMDSAITFPSLFYCKIDDSSTRKSTLLYSSDKFWLESVFPPDIQSRLSLNIADDDKNYDLRLNLLGEQVHFRQGTSFVTTHVPDHVWIVKKDEIDKIREVVKRYIHFYSCLELISPHNIREIGIELNELARKGNDFVSLHSCILGEDPIYISASSTKKYGLTLRNHTMDHFYPYLFCFDPMDLTISESLSRISTAPSVRLNSLILVKGRYTNRLLLPVNTDQPKRQTVPYCLRQSLPSAMVLATFTETVFVLNYLKDNKLPLLTSGCIFPLVLPHLRA